MAGKSFTAIGCLGLTLAFLVIAAGSAFTYGFVIMLVLGILHGVWRSVPALGFWPCVAIGLLFGLLTGGRSAQAKR
jgi:hypothetical protein